MRFMVFVKASPESESGGLPTEQELTEMGAYNEKLVKAGVMVAGKVYSRVRRGSGCASLVTSGR